MTMLLGLLSLGPAAHAALIRVQVTDPTKVTIKRDLERVGCSAAAGAVGSTELVAVAATGRDRDLRATQLVSVKFGECTFIFARMLDDTHDSSTVYALTGDITIAPDNRLSVSYERFGSRVEEQMKALAEQISAADQPALVQIPLYPAH